MQIVLVIFLKLQSCQYKYNDLPYFPVNPTVDKQLNTNGKIRISRSTDGFDVDDMPKAKLSRGTFADEKPNVNGVKRGGGNLMAVGLESVIIFRNFNHFSLSDYCQVS